jgi:hypothetical protein
MSLPGDPSQELNTTDMPLLDEHVGHELVTSDGTTLLGADDKAGCAEIMAAAAYLLRHPEIPHGRIRVAFTPDEEVGRGTDYFDLAKFGADVAYTLDGKRSGEIDDETFSAAKAVLTFDGRSTHPGTAKGVMVNAIKMAGDFLASLPREERTPETTEDRAGFVHPTEIEGGVESCRVEVILRDFDEDELAGHEQLVRRLAEEAAVRAPGEPRVARWSRSPRLALAAAALLAVALLPAWIELREVQRLRSDLVRAQGERGSAERLGAELEQTRRDLAAEADKREALAREMAADRRPQTNLPILALTPVRGSGGGPVPTLTLPKEPGWVAFWVEPGDTDFPAYRATLLTSQGAVVFQASPLTLNDLGALLVTVHSTSLSSGSYRLDLEGLPKTGAPVPAGRFLLRME